MEFERFSVKDPDRREEFRWDRARRLPKVKFELESEASIARIIGRSLRKIFPNALVSTHPRPKKS